MCLRGQRQKGLDSTFYLDQAQPYHQTSSCSLGVYPIIAQGSWQLLFVLCKQQLCALVILSSQSHQLACNVATRSISHPKVLANCRSSQRLWGWFEQRVMVAKSGQYLSRRQYSCDKTLYVTASSRGVWVGSDKPGKHHQENRERHGEGTQDIWPVGEGPKPSWHLSYRPQWWALHSLWEEQCPGDTLEYRKFPMIVICLLCW